MTKSLSELLDQADFMMAGSDDLGTSATGLVGSMVRSEDVVVEPPIQAELFSTYMVTPTYYVDTDSMTLVKLSSANGDPFFIVDPERTVKAVVCGNTRIFIAPYNAQAACSDDCDGMPALHLITRAFARSLMTMALKGIPNAGLFAGLVFISSVSMQFYYTIDTEEPVTFRVATDAEGSIAMRDEPGALTCDYPVPYFLIDYCVFAEGAETCSLIQSVTKANASLIDTLCRMEYKRSLHPGLSKLPDALETTLTQFMGSHSNTMRCLLEKQLQEPCDDAFTRRKRKTAIDNLARLMMREVELVGEIKKKIEDLVEVETAVMEAVGMQEEEKPVRDEELATVGAALDDDVMLQPLMRPAGPPQGEPLVAATERKRREAAMPVREVVVEEEGDTAEIDEMLMTPLRGRDDTSDMMPLRGSILDADLLRSPSSSSCSVTTNEDEE